MRRDSRELSFVTVLVIIGLILHRYVLALPFILTLPTLIVSLVPKPLVYVSIIAIVAELFSTTPLGLVSSVVFLPYIISRITGSWSVDFSFKYIFLILALVGGQLLLTFAPDILGYFEPVPRLDITAGSIRDLLPWRTMIWSWSLSTALVFFSSIIIFYNRKP